MNKIFSKKSLAVLLTVLMLFSMVPAFSITASASDHIPVTGIKVTVSGASSESLSSGTLTVTAKGGLFSKKTATVTVYNNTESSAQVSFDYTASSANSFTVAGASAGTSGSYSALLDAGASVVVSITSNSGLSNTTATLKLSNFGLVEAKTASNVTFDFDSNYGTVSVAGEAVTGGTTKEIAMTGAALVATTANSGRFLGWIDAASGSILSTAASYTLTPATDMTVKAIFVGADSKPYFAVGGASQKSSSTGLFGMSKLYYYEVGSSYIFDDLKAAATFAASDSSNKTLILLNDSTLPAGDYTIPAGVTLLIPFNSTNTMYTTQAQAIWDSGSTDSYVQPTAYRTLTMADGANLTINGAVSLSAKHRAAQGSKANGGSPMGPVSFIKMQGSSNITVNNGGALYAYGFIYGSGTVTANSGATVYENFQIMDFRGGTQSTDMDNGVFPISQYYVQNIEVPMTIYSGATEYAYTTIYMSSADFGSAVAFISNKNAMFNLSNGYVVKKYDGATDRLIVESYGDITVSPINMEIGTSSINSKNYELPINSNLTFTAQSGTITMGQDIALLPGAELIVEESASCTLGSGVNVYVYDADEWGNYTFGASNINSKFKPVTYAPGRTYTRTEADIKDAMIQVDGTVNALAGYVYTTTGGANIYGNGQVMIAPGVQTVTHQFIQAGSIKNADGTTTAVTASYVEIPLTSAKLQNADGTVVETGYVAGTYTSTDGIWNKTECQHSYKETINTPATCEAEGLKTFTCLDTANCGYSYTEAIPALAHTEEVISAVAPTCTQTGLTEGKKCSVCGEILTAQETVAATSHNYEAVVTAPDCTTAGYTTYTCSVCGDSYVSDEVAALGHSPVTDEAVEPTYDSTGLTEGSHCSVCGEVLVAQETIPAKEYILGDADHNDEINILDLIALKKALLDDEEYTVVVDMDKNATVDSLDLVALKVYLWDNF